MIEKQTLRTTGRPLGSKARTGLVQGSAVGERTLKGNWIHLLAFKIAMGRSIAAALREVNAACGSTYTYMHARNISHVPAFCDLVKQIQDENMGQSTARFLHKIAKHGPKQVDALEEIARTGTPDDSVRRGAAKDLVDTFVKVSGLAARAEATANDSSFKPGQIRPLKLEDHETLRLREALAEAQDAEVVAAPIESEPCAKRAGQDNAPSGSGPREPSEAPPNDGKSESESKPRKASAPTGNGKRAKVTTMAELKAALAGREPPRYVETRGL